MQFRIGRGRWQASGLRAFPGDADPVLWVLQETFIRRQHETMYAILYDPGSHEQACRKGGERRKLLAVARPY